MTSINHNTSSQLGYVIMQHDIDNDGNYDDFYVKYLHIDPKDSLKIDDEYSVNDSFATIDYDRGLGYGTHLDFSSRESGSGSGANITKKLYHYYRHVDEWEDGAALELLSGDAIIESQNALYINGISSTNIGDKTYPLKKIEVYYKVNDGSWSTTPKEMELVFPDIYRWKFDFDEEIPSLSSGDTVYFYLAGIRGNDDGDFSSNYDWGLWPQYYKEPHKTPSSISNNDSIIYRAYTIQ